ncbi:hypothetical protein HDV06_003856 [Boothiomyces sp. JEL0866]|nr:hypothetical protein HDV06_003856 [Boothiomyces sp. JEL0866]
MSKLERKQRLKQLEKERQLFYSRSNIDKNSSAEDLYEYKKKDEKPELQKEVEAVDTMMDRFKTHGLKPHVDAFEKLVSKDHKNRVKVILIFIQYYVSDKSLLEDERARNAMLEESYEKLLLQVQQLQNTHLTDLRNSEQRFHSASTALQKALVSKSEELISLSNKLASSQGRYERDSREWAKERASFIAQIDTLSATTTEQNTKIADRERKLTELSKLRRELAERIAGREQDLIKYGKALRDREADYINEKENRIKLEAKILKVEKDLERKEIEMRDLQTALNRKHSELEEFGALKLNLNEAKRDLEDLQRREKHFIAELDQVSTRERKLCAQVEEYASNERKHVNEITKLTEKQAALTNENDDLRRVESRLQQELSIAQSKNEQRDEELGKLDKQVRQYQQDAAKLLQELSNIQMAAQELKNNNNVLSKELLNYKQIEQNLGRDRDALLTSVNTLQKELQVKNSELDHAEQQIKELSGRLEAEIAQQAESKAINKEKFNSVSVKIAELQDTLAETQNQLTELRSNEKTLRAALKQREDSLRSQSASLVESENRIQELLSNMSKENLEFETYKNKKRDELLAIQDKYSLAKQAMEADVNQLRFQFTQKQSQLANAVEEISHLKSELTEYATAKASLETRVSELLAAEGSYQRQIANLNANLNQNKQELSRVTNRHTSLMDQTKRLDEELQMYRESTTNNRDADISRLQNNMEDLSKRLKSQVDTLLERDSEASHSRSASAQPSPLKTRFSIVSGVKDSAYSPKSAPKPTDEFEQIDRLLNRTYSKSPAFVEHSNESDQTLATVISQDTIQMIKECLKQENKSLLKSKGLFDISSELRSYGDQNKKRVTFSQPLVTYIGQTSTEYFKILQLKRSAMVGEEKIIDLTKHQNDAEVWSDISDEVVPSSENTIPRSLASLSNCSIEIRPPSRLSEISSDSEANPDSISLVSIDSEDDFCGKPVDIDLEMQVVTENSPARTLNENVQTDKKAKLKRMPTFQIKRERERMEIQNVKRKSHLPAIRTVHITPAPAVPVAEVPVVIHAAQQQSSNLKKKSKFEKEKKRQVEFTDNGKWIEDSTDTPQVQVPQVVTARPQLKLDMKDSAISITTQSTQSMLDRDLPLEEISVCSADSAWLNDGVPEEVSVCSADSDWLNEPSLPVVSYSRPLKPSPLSYTVDDESSELSLNSTEDWSVSPIPDYKQSGISKLKETFRKIFSKK